MKTILLVDDEQQAIDVFQAALSAEGYEVDIAQNGRKALDLAKTKKFDVIILDEMMPDMSGNNIIKVLKEDQMTASIPIIVLTNYSEDQLVKEAMNAGANEYILKYQMTPTDLADKIKSMIGD